jgi:hypothetical protein
VELGDRRRLADSRVPGDQHELGGAAVLDAIERAGQSGDLFLASVESFRDDQLRRHVVIGQREL